LRTLGADVVETWQVAQYIPGFPDALALFRGQVIAVEIKMPGEKLTKDEATFALLHRDLAPNVVENADDCRALLARYGLSWSEDGRKEA
jgi:hypothetical protein